MRHTESVTYPHPGGNGAPPPAYPPAPPMQPMPMPPTAAGPPALRALQGQMQNPIPVMVAAAGLMLICLSSFLPLAGYSHEGTTDPLREYFYLPERHTELYLTLGEHPAVVPLIGAVAITIALAGSRRWLLFGRLASLGLALLGVSSAVGAAFAWQQQLRELVEGADDYREAMSGEEAEAVSEAADKVDIDFAAGLWVLVAGIIALAVAVILIKTAPRGHQPYPPVSGPRQPLGYPVQPPVQGPNVPQGQAPIAYPAAAAAPVPEPAGDRDVSVHDDPPSLSIYKPPPKEA